jgi:hypothetical protein
MDGDCSRFPLLGTIRNSSKQPVQLNPCAHFNRGGCVIKHFYILPSNSIFTFYQVIDELSNAYCINKTSLGNASNSNSGGVQRPGPYDLSCFKS